MPIPRLPRCCGFVLMSSLIPACQGPSTSSAPPVTPVTQRGPDVDTYFGTPVPDPYRWLEDADGAETAAWVAAQNRVTRAWIDAVPEREAIEARLRALWNYERHGVPRREGERWFYERNDGLQNQPVWYVTESLDAPGRALLDPNTLSQDGTRSVGDATPSPGGALFAYSVAEAGSDWETVHVRDVESGTDLEDRVDWVKFSNTAWSSDGGGFYYSTFAQRDTRSTARLEGQELRYHRLGTPQAEDRLVCARPDEPEWGFSAEVSDDGTLLAIRVTRGTDPRTQLFVQDLVRPNARVIELVTGFDAEFEFVEKSGRTLYVKTDLDAPLKRIVAIDLARPAREHWREVVPERPGRTLVAALLAGGQLVCSYLEDAHSTLDVVAPEDGARRAVELPGLCTLGAFAGRPRERELRFAWSSFTQPACIERLDLETLARRRWTAPRTAFDPARYVTTLEFAASRDGTRVPYFLTHAVGAPPGPATPCLLYGYGGFDVSITPEFSPAVMGWLELGGSYASAVLRGGGEYGRAWHAAGTGLTKQNTFDDFIACAEHLVASGRTSVAKLAIHGRSNGGLLVGAVLNQRPELFGAAVPGVGVLDLLRYQHFTIGWAWESDYGLSDRSQAEFAALHAYSPVHTTRAGTHYPATLITTADHDDRVVPAHSYKYAAALQAAQSGPAPILLRVDVRAGHGTGKPTAARIEEWADVWAFLWRALGQSGAGQT